MSEVKLVPLKAIRCEQRIRKDYGDIEALAQSIATVGLLHPIVLDPTYRLIVGERRLRAYEYLGKAEIPATITEAYEDVEQALYAERDENTARKDWVPTEAVAMADKLAPYERQAAEARQYQAGVRGHEGGRGRKKDVQETLVQTLHKGSQPRMATRSSVRTAKAVGLSRPSLAKAQAVVRAAKDDPARFGPIVQQMDETGKVDGAYRKVQKAKHVDQLRAREISPQAFDGLYDVLVIDPPWPVGFPMRETRPNQLGFDYLPMTVEQIHALTLPTAEACHVWLWTTQRFLPEAFACLTSWQLSYICCFVWHKAGGMQPVGLPQLNCEFALYARKGAPPFVATTDFFTCFQAPRHEHSAKPDAFYALVRRVTAGRRLDMFNRRPIAGFDGWGTETLQERTS